MGPSLHAGLKETAIFLVTRVDSMLSAPPPQASTRRRGHRNSCLRCWLEVRGQKQPGPILLFGFLCHGCLGTCLQPAGCSSTDVSETFPLVVCVVLLTHWCGRKTPEPAYTPGLLTYGLQVLEKIIHPVRSLVRHMMSAQLTAYGYGCSSGSDSASRTISFFSLL